MFSTENNVALKYNEFKFSNLNDQSEMLTK